MRLRETRKVDAGAESAFGYTSDFSNIAEWDPGVSRSERVDEGDLGVGSVFDLDVSFGKSTVPMKYEIILFEPGERVVLEGRGSKLHAIDDIRFTPHGNGTRIDYQADLTFDGLIRFLLPVMGRRLEQVGTKALDGLQRCLNR